jgi:predicted NUDIX family NTP pyrophosphohydrolase
VKQAGGKIVKAWTIRHDLDPPLLKEHIQSAVATKVGNDSGIPEMDSGAWFSLAVARRKIVKAQKSF